MTGAGEARCERYGGTQGIHYDWCGLRNNRAAKDSGRVSRTQGMSYGEVAGRLAPNDRAGKDQPRKGWQPTWTRTIGGLLFLQKDMTLGFKRLTGFTP